METAHLKFFNIQKCGFYLRGGSGTEFSGINDTLQTLHNWARDGREFVNTTTYEADPDNDLRNTYFCDWESHGSNSDSALTIWTEVPNDNGVIYGMHPLSRPGGTSMLTSGFGEGGAIPGFPSYFWFLPEKNVFASVRFEHSVQGKGNLENYLNGFLANKSPYRVINTNGDVVGFSPSGQPTATSDRLLPRFQSRGRTDNELEAELLANLHRIRRIIKREDLAYQLPDSRSYLEHIFSGVLSSPPPSHYQTRRISHELQFEPTEQQLREILDNFSQRDESSPLRNVGFVYSDGHRVMLSGKSVSLKIDLDIERRRNQIFTPDALLDSLTQQRRNIIRMLDGADD